MRWHFQNRSLPGHFFGISFSLAVWLIERFADQRVGGVVYDRIADNRVAKGTREAGFDLRQSLIRKTGESFFLGGLRGQID